MSVGLVQREAGALAPVSIEPKVVQQQSSIAVGTRNLEKPRRQKLIRIDIRKG
jgi:hypothetical protein